MGLGLNVPPTIVIPVDETPDAADIANWCRRVLGADPKWRLAIRSSSFFEDSGRESQAGHYLSLLGTFDTAAVEQAIEQVRESGPRMAVIIQPLLDASYAGVLFSCDPLSYSKDELTIVWTEGLANQLVSGNDPGKRICVGKGGAILAGAWPASEDSMTKLVRGALQIEENIGGPADIEWVCDEAQRLWFVQARPVVLPPPAVVSLESEASFSRLPAIIQQHSKIRLRKRALKAGVIMAPALVECWSDNGAGRPTANNMAQFEKAAGASVVLLHPARVENQVVREFAPVRGQDVEFFSSTCRRYSIRRYPRANGIAPAKESVLQAGFAHCWISAAIVQAIWDAYATGIIQRSADGYVIELARGHFIPKGVVPTSTIILSPEQEVVSAVWRDQPRAYRFIDGHVLTEELRVPRMSLEDGVLRDIAKTLDPLLDSYENAALEFGILQCGVDHLVYLIDVAEGDTGGIALDAQLINSGVLSTGCCRGRAVRVDLSTMGTLDKHLHDRPDTTTTSGDDVVIVAERASVDLLPYIGAPGVVGFVFERGSVLAHLAVVLREKGIPAIALEDSSLFAKLPVGLAIEIDASNRNLPTSERIKITGVHDARSGMFVHQS
jgi:phosphohistidine swiveling domain-containing protein